MTIIRKCSKCNEIKQIVGKNWCCRECKNKYERERIKKNPERQKEINKLKNEKYKQIKYLHRLQKIKDNPEKEREYQRNNYKRKKDLGINQTRYNYETSKKYRENWEKKYPHKRKCQLDFAKSVKRGFLIRPNFCQICNSEEKIQGHHEDYTKPLEVIWCCIACHTKLDIKRRKKRMARISDTFNIGDKSELNMEKLLEIMQRMYMDLAEAVNSKPDLYQRNTDGQVSDTFLAQGSININLSTNKVEMLTNHPTQTTVTWVTLG